MKVLFMGTPDFAVGILSAICEKSDHEVVAVVTQPDRPKGRSGVPVFSPVKQYAEDHGLMVIQPVKIKEADEVSKLRGIEADIYVVAAFGQILSKEILDIPKYGCINVHASLLPKYRGAAPIQWAVADGLKTTGVTIQQMNEGVDTGDIISSKEVAIDDDETGGSLFDKLMNASAVLITDTLDMIEAGTAVHTPQDESEATYAKMLKKEMGLIDFARPAVEIERLIRAFTPWPGGFTYLNGKMLKIKKCHASDENTGECAKITKVSKDTITVACGKGSLVITALQSEGKKEMSAHDFLLGNSLSVGTKLGM
ncbi:MAG: methionyl-tRNA formyltransferase [Lachnospiraceae bacterium]|nr:methionyl-tRNA formyltransferase [Lachnospiraceae bacterium]